MEQDEQLVQQANTQRLRAWLDSGRHLPKPIRDFHDAKLFFKWLVWDRMKDKADDPYLKGINFVSAQVFVIDYFLWFMAAHGYTLQKTKKDFPTYDLQNTMTEYEKRLSAQQFTVLSEVMKKRTE